MLCLKFWTKRIDFSYFSLVYCSVLFLCDFSTNLYRYSLVVGFQDWKKASLRVSSKRKIFSPIMVLKFEFWTARTTLIYEMKNENDFEKEEVICKWESIFSFRRRSWIIWELGDHIWDGKKNGWGLEPQFLDLNKFLVYST